MENRIWKGILAFLLISMVLLSAFSGVAAYHRNEISSSASYLNSHSSSSMSGTKAREISLGALTLPGHNIIEDYRAEMIVRSQHYNMKVEVMLHIMSIISLALCIIFFVKAFTSTKKSYRLLI